MDGKSYEVLVELLDEAPPPAGPRPAEVSAPPAAHEPAPASTPTAGKGAVTCPLAGRVVSVDCTKGQKVENGTQLLTIEAMKMNTYVHAHVNGTISGIHVQAGEAVEEGQELMTIE